MEENIKELKQKTISGVFWRFGERITAQVITFVVSMILARLILPEEYGVIAIVTIFINIANVLVTNGLGTSLIQKNDAGKKDFSTMFYASMILSICLYGILFILAPIIARIFNNDMLILLLRVMGLRIPIAAINSIQQAYVAKKMIYKKFFFSTLFGTVISAIVGIFMAYNNFGVWALVGQYITNSVIDTVVLFLTIDWKPTLYFSYKRFKEMFSFGWKIMISSLIGAFFGQLRSLIIGGKYTSADLAYYNKGDQIPALITNNVNLTVESVFFSTISEIQNDIEKVKQTTRKILKMSCYIIMPLLLGLAAISESFVRLVLTEKWISCVPFIQVFCFQYCFSIFGTVNLQSLKGIGKSDTILKLEFVKKPLFIIMIIITMHINPFAIAIGGLIYDIIASFINSIPNWKYLNYSIQEQLMDLVPYFLISLSMFVIVWMINFLNIGEVMKIIIQIIIGGGYYILISKVLKISCYNEIINILKSKKGK